MLIEVAAGLIFRQGKLLIAQRLPQAHLGGLWEFPGGKRNSSESFEECLRRELHEELGLEVEVGDLIDSITHHYAEKSVHLKFFRCAILGGEPRAIHCSAVAWVEAGQLEQYEFPAADARLLQRLKSDAKLWQH